MKVILGIIAGFMLCCSTLTADQIYLSDLTDTGEHGNELSGGNFVVIELGPGGG